MINTTIELTQDQWFYLMERTHNYHGIFEMKDFVSITSDSTEYIRMPYIIEKSR